MVQNHINSAIIEDVKPMMYQMHRWVGRKPSNIWRKYIETYTKPGDIVFDAMCGSGIAPIEAVVSGRKGIGFDQDPMAIFVSENIAKYVDEKEFRKLWKELKEDFNTFETNHPIYTTECTGGELWKRSGIEKVQGCGNKNSRIANFRFDTDEADSRAPPNKIVYTCKCQDTYIIKDASDDEIREYTDFQLPPDVEWYPKTPFPQNVGMFEGIKQKYGISFDRFWSLQNLYFLAHIFSRINQIQNEDQRKLFLFAFTSTLHLSSKIPASRKPETCRPGAGSLGRTTLDLLLNERIEQNPFVLFERTIEHKQGLLKGKFSNSINNLKSCECDANHEYYFSTSMRELPNSSKCNHTIIRKIGYTSSHFRVGDVNFVENFNELNLSADPKTIFLKKVKMNNIVNEIPENSIDFVITDPPYGDLVPYMGISSIWSVWLAGPNNDDYFTTPFEDEITIDASRNMDIAVYQRMLNQMFREYFRVLKPNTYMIVTFHNKKPRIYNALKIACQNAGFDFEHIHFNQNLRAGETGSANPAGTANSDFYFRFRKPENAVELTSPSINDFTRIVIHSISEGLASRGSPTKIDELLPSLLTELNQQGLLLDYESDNQIEGILNTNNTIFEKLARGEWWLTNDFINTHRLQIPLDERIDLAIIQTLRQRPSTLDQILDTLFTTFQDSFTPNESITSTIKKYADWDDTQSRWKIKPEEDLSERQLDTLHTQKQIKLAEIGIKKGYKIWCPRPDTGKSVNLKRLCISGNFPISGLSNSEKIKLIDVLWIKDKKIKYAFEVENSTTITSALERCSPLPSSETKKIIVLPSQRKAKLASKMKTPFFKKWWDDEKWKRIWYEDLDKMTGTDIDKIMQ